MKRQKTLIATALSLATLGMAQAEVNINGFANLVVGKASDPVYRYDTDIDFSEESLFAIQLSADINNKTTATAQLLSRGSDDYHVDFEWAYITHELSASSQISAGRLRLPLFRYSASQDVGYSYHFITPPQSVYDAPYNNIDGVRYDYQGFSGKFDYNFQVAFGQSDTDFEMAGQPTTLTIDTAALISGEVGYQSLRGRAVFATADVSMRNASLDGATAAIASVSESLAASLRAEDDTGIFWGVGIDYDDGLWFMAAEFTHVEIDDSFYPDQDSFYITGGARLDKWTPFFVHEVADRNNAVAYPSALNELPVPAQEQLLPIVSGLQMAAMQDTQATTLGVRYDWSHGVSIKADVTRYQDNINNVNDSTLSRLAVNYVF